MDRYTKAILTVIAVGLVIIAYDLTFKPTPAIAFIGGGPTYGDYLAAIQDQDASTDPRDVVKSAPLIVACERFHCGRRNQ